MDTYTIPIHDLTLCQFCHKPRGEGVKLQRCSACKIYTYCSVACQTKAWKATHRRECSYIDLPSLTPQDSGRLVVAAMRAFANKHSTMISTIALDVLDVDPNPEQGFQDAIVIRLRLRPEPTLVETMFEATDASVYSIDGLGDHKRSQEIFDHLRANVECHRRSGKRYGKAACGVHVILRNTDFNLIDIIPFFFSENHIHLPPRFGPEYTGSDWKKGLLTFLNGGIIREEQVPTF